MLIASGWCLPANVDWKHISISLVAQHLEKGKNMVAWQDQLIDRQVQYLSDSTKITENTESAMLCTDR